MKTFRNFIHNIQEFVKNEAFANINKEIAEVTHKVILGVVKNDIDRIHPECLSL